MVIKFGPNQTFTRTRDHGKVESYPTGFYTVPGPHHHCDPNERAPAGKKCCCINHSHCQFGLCGSLTGGGTIVSNPTGHGGGGSGRHTHHHGSSTVGVGPNQNQHHAASTPPANTSNTASNNNTSNLIAMGALIGIPLIMLLMLL